MSLLPAGNWGQKMIFTMFATWIAAGFITSAMRDWGVYDWYNPAWNIVIALGIMFFLVRYVR